MSRKKYRVKTPMRLGDVPRGSIFLTGYHSAYIKCIGGIVAAHGLVDPTYYFRPYIVRPNGAYLNSDTEVCVIGYCNSVTKGMLQDKVPVPKLEDFKSFDVAQIEGGPIVMWLGTGLGTDDMSVDLLKWDLVPNSSYRDRKWYRVGNMVPKVQECKHVRTVDRSVICSGLS